MIVSDEFNENAEAVFIEDDTLAALRSIPSGVAKLIVSSPPYNIGKVYETETELDQYLEWQKEVIRESIRILSETGSVVWQVGNYIQKGEVFPLDIYFYPIFKSLGMKLRNRIIWHFEHGLHAKNRFSGRYETLLWFTKTDEYTFNLDSVRVPSKYPGKLHYKGSKKGQPSGNPLGKNPSDFWQNIFQKEWEEGIINIPNVKSNHPEKTEHPCQFPIELIERCVLAFTDESDLVVDPFGGVGTSLIAAIKNKRKAVSIDKEACYIKISKERLNDFISGELKIRPLGKTIHKPSGNERVSQVPTSWLAVENKKQGSLL